MPRASKKLSHSISNIPQIKINTIFYRCITEKFSGRMTDTEHTLKCGSRYNPPDEFGALYLGESREVCIAEMESKSGSIKYISAIMGEIKVSLDNVLDLTDPHILKKIGISEKSLTISESNGGYELTQDIARIAYKAGFEAILYQSITGKGKNLALFDKYINNTIKIINKETV
jgi:RES domain-containing protein